MKPLAAGIGHGQVEHLVEVAVIDRTFPTDADEISAHQLVESGVIEVVSEQFHVIVVFTADLEMGLIARDRHVAETIEMIEHNAELFSQYPSIVLLKSRLRRRQMGPDGIVDQI